MLDKIKKSTTTLFVFIKKHWIVISIIVVIIAILVALFNFIPVISVNNLKLVNLDSSVRIESGQTVKLKGNNASVKIAHFTNDTCPKGGTCFWSGQAVEYVLTVNNQEYATGSVSRTPGGGYQIKTISSDYKTYAEIQISSTKNED